MIVDIRFRTRGAIQIQRVIKTSVTTGPKGFLLVIWKYDDNNGNTIRHIYMLKDIADTKFTND